MYICANEISMYMRRRLVCIFYVYATQVNSTSSYVFTWDQGGLHHFYSVELRLVWEPQTIPYMGCVVADWAMGAQFVRQIASCDTSTGPCQLPMYSLNVLNTIPNALSLLRVVMGQRIPGDVAFLQDSNELFSSSAWQQLSPPFTEIGVTCPT